MNALKVFECDDRNGHAMIVIAATIDEARELSGCYDVKLLDLTQSRTTDYECHY